MSAKAIILSIGDEILYGQTLDTNAHWISGALDNQGIKVIRRLTIGDTREDILATLKDAESRADIILITGGLGPTNDDLTKPCLVEYFDTHLVRNETVLSHIQTLFDLRGRELSELNKQQADLPANCEAVPNPMGTAPGMWFERNGKVLVSMPGVPYEMKQMMEETVLPKLKKIYSSSGVAHRIIRTVGVPESVLAEKIKTWEDNLPPHIKLAYLPSMGSVKLRLTTDKDDELRRSEMQAQIDAMLPLIEKYVYGFDDEELEEAIGRLLKRKKMTVSVAESCTGGYLSHRLTSVPGSSAWFSGAVVPYSNKLKIEKLAVPLDALNQHGAVSEPVVLALADNVRTELGTDIGISVSGIAGPGGGTPEKPVGTVWIGYSDKSKTVAKKFQFIRDREINIKYTAVAALNMIRINIDKD